ncbi:CamS family sex pheromone protein [Bacillus massiliigorillae]|uniref:CamS family sex pheromone protein n=1 Tax=Bacillus massiliigorillae TaxID=1243664 RepID=UPI0003AA7D34|nr:CamS family sex pheromone protein [Bacillus massiliigorillae]
MKRILCMGLAFMLLLSGCAPKYDSQEQGGQKNKDNETKAIIPKYKISDKYYQTILPFEPSKARGQVVSNLNTRYDMNEMEMGLMRIAQESFNPDKYFFKEGQFLSTKKVKSWLERKYTPEQLKANKMKESENLGLNPIDPGKGDIEKRNEENPLYLAHILEHNYMVRKSDNKVGLGGVVIGLALNSTHYYQKEEFGDVFDVDIPNEKMMAEGKKIAQEVLNRLRQDEDLKNVPITIALFKQQKKNAVVPGNFVAYTEVGQGSSQISSWKKVNEKYYLFPSSEAEEQHRDDNKLFLNFKQDIEKYFPNFNGVIGRAFYIDDQLTDLKIDIPIQFYGKSEAVGFTQYVAGKVMEIFPDYINVQVAVSSVSGQESLIVRNADSKEPFVHIYQ